MFLFDRIGLLALLGLFAQAAMTWLFVCLFSVLLRDGHRPRHLREWRAAFVALAIGLSLICFRFFRAHDAPMPARWGDGAPIVTAIYSVYLLAKVLFAQWLLRGAASLSGQRLPALVRRLDWPLRIGFAAAPLVFVDITLLLALQTPVMVGYGLLSWSLMRERGSAGAGAGRRLVRLALIAFAAVWVVHGICSVTALVTDSLLASTWLGLNSHVDAGVELLLGSGLIVTQLQDAHQRLQRSLEEQARLRQERSRDEKLLALGALVSGVAHELNNPLTAILGFARDIGEPSRAAYASQVVGEQAERCRGIVRSLSALAGECAHPRRAVDCTALVERVVRGLERQALAAGVTLQLQLGPTPMVLADPIGIEQVVANLLANAIDASPRGGVVRLHGGVAGPVLVLHVDDNGPGVPAELQKRLFEPFFTTKPSGKGTGLGLAVAFAIVRSHQGTLRVADAPEGGARFTVRLPLAEPQLQATTATAEAPAPAGARRMLVVDDEPTIRAALRSHGERLGWTMILQPSAEAALRHLEQHEVDVVLCDLRMPGLGGAGFYGEVRRLRPQLLPRCMFFTGDLASAEAVAFARELESPLIPKPFDFTELFRRAASLARSAAPVGGAGPWSG
ncbi:MAG: ATP-binding protein [Planctomycetota bacterium]